MREKARRKLRVFFLSLLGIIASILFWYGKTIYKPLAYLPVPRIASIDLPAGLTFPSYETSVLGAQTILPTDIVKYVNIAREENGAKPLRLSTILMKAAQMRADVILKYQNFSHQDPYENIELATVLPKLNYHFVYASENIGMGGQSAEDFVKGFIGSPSHKANLLNPNLSDTGIALVTGPYKQYYVNIVVHIFAIPGGKEEYLGYTAGDIKKYKSLLNEVNIKLNPIVWTVNRLRDNSEFTDKRYQRLVRQKEILTNIYMLMQKEKPLQNAQVALILEYNNNLN